MASLIKNMENQLMQKSVPLRMYVPSIHCFGRAAFILAILAFIFMLSACGDLPTGEYDDIEGDRTTVTLKDIPGITIPATGGIPNFSISETAQYTGTVSWSPLVSGTFNGSTVYTATIELKAKAGFTFLGLGANFFTLLGAEAVSNPANSGRVTATFPATGVDYSGDGDDGADSVITMVTNAMGTTGIYLVGIGDVKIDWGDGTVQTIRVNSSSYFDDLSKSSNHYAHIYTRTGNKTVAITGSIVGIATGETNTVSAMDLSGCPGLKFLNCEYENLALLNLSKNTALEVLYCGNNRLASLDASKLPALKVLQCGYNNLNTLNVSGLASLRELSCYQNNLSALQLSGCVALESLRCDDNAISALNLAGLAALKELWCGGNNLSALNVSGLTALKELNCNENSITSLSVSGLSLLELLNCDRNNITSLNASGLASLKTLSCQENALTSLQLSGCIALESLRCDDNAISALTVAGFTALKELGCGSNYLSSLTITGCSALQYLICKDNALGAVALNALFDALPASPGYPAILNIEGNPGIYQTGYTSSKATSKGWNLYD